MPERVAKTMCSFSSQVSSICARAGPRFLGLNPDRRGDFLVGAQLEQVGDGAALGGAAHFRNLVNFLDVGAAGLGKEHQVIVRRRGEEMLDEIAFLFLGRAFARGHADDAFAAAALGAERADRGPLDEAAVGDADDASLVGDQVLHVDLAFVGDELGQARRGVLVADFAQLFLDDLEDARFLREDVAQILDRLDQLAVFLRDLFALESGELIKAQVEDLVRLVFAEGVTAVDEPRFVADEDADFLDLFPGELEREQV